MVNNKLLSSQSFAERYGVRDDGLVLFLQQLDGRSGVSASQWNDLSGYHNHAVQATSGSQPGVTAQYRTFATTKYMTVPDQDVFSCGNAGTDIPYSWFGTCKINASAATRCVATKFNRKTGSLKTEFFIYFSTSHQLGARIYNGTTTTTYLQQLSVVGSPLSTNTVYSWAVTYSGSKANSGIILYVNGEKMSSTGSTSGTYTGTSNTTQDVLVGCAIGPAGAAENAFNGDIYTYGMVYNRVLTNEEIRRIYRMDYQTYGVLNNQEFSPDW